MAKNNEKEYSDFVKQNLWKVRPCAEYKAEAKECKSIKGRFHQYFTKGSFTDCTSLVQDSKNSQLCWEHFDNLACLEVIQNENKRIHQRLKVHRENNVWEKRSQPPEDWSKPLPDYLSQQWKESNVSSYAEEVQKLVDEEKLTYNTSFCVIL